MKLSLVFFVKNFFLRFPHSFNYFSRTSQISDLLYFTFPVNFRRISSKNFAQMFLKFHFSFLQYPGKFPSNFPHTFLIFFQNFPGFPSIFYKNFFSFLEFSSQTFIMVILLYCKISGEVVLHFSKSKTTYIPVITDQTSSSIFSVSF